MSTSNESMKPKSAIWRIVFVVGLAITLATVGLLGLSYYDVRASVGTGHISLVSVTPHYSHLLVVRWRTGPYDPDNDMAGNYVLWTLRPFRKVHWFK